MAGRQKEHQEEHSDSSINDSDLSPALDSHQDQGVSGMPDLSGKASSPAQGKDPVMERLENALFNAPFDQEIYVDLSFTITTAKNRAILTFTRQRSGELEVRNGVRSLNATTIAIKGFDIPIKGAVALKEGDSFKMADAEVSIPVSRDDVKTDLDQDILGLEPGELLPIGRTYYQGEYTFPDGTVSRNFPDEVSRRHCTLKRLDDVVDANGNTRRTYEIVDGVQGTKSVAVDNDEGTWDEFDGKINLGPGRKLRIGVDGPVLEAPDELQGFDWNDVIKGKLDTVCGESICASVSAYSQVRNIKAGEPELSGPTSDEPFPVRPPGADVHLSIYFNPEELSGMPLSKRQKFQALEKWIKDGLDKTRRAEHIFKRAETLREEADNIAEIDPDKAQELREAVGTLLRQSSDNFVAVQKHFEKAKILEGCGMQLGSGNLICSRVSRITAEVIHSQDQMIAARSWFKAPYYSDGTPEVVPSFGMIVLDRTLDNQRSLNADAVVVEENQESVDLSLGIPEAKSWRAVELADPRLDPEERWCLAQGKMAQSRIYIEEWGHSLQHLKGSLISKKAALIENLPRAAIQGPLEEIDIAEFIGERQVTKSDDYNSRYGRDIAHAALRDYATREEKNAIRGRLVLAEVDQAVVIGLGDSTRTDQADQQYAISTTPAGELREEAAEPRRMYIEQQIRPDHIVITPLGLDAKEGVGRYLVEPVAPEERDGKVFRRDTFGKWIELTGDETLASGTTLRLGVGFEFKLP